MSRVVDPRERDRSHAEVQQVDFYTQALKASEQFRKDYQGRLNVVKAAQMPLERSPDGLIKHIINERMDTENCRFTLQALTTNQVKENKIYERLEPGQLYSGDFRREHPLHSAQPVADRFDRVEYEILQVQTDLCRLF